MLIGDLLPATLAAWKPRRATRSTDVQVSRPIAAAPRPAMRNAATAPRGMTSVVHETQTVLSAVNGYARSRFVELQVATEPCLGVQADPADYRESLRNLLLAAIGRASSGVLVTAMWQADGVEITVLDDGTLAAGARPDGQTPGANDLFAPAGGTLHTDYHPQRGTTVRWHLPQPDGLAFPSDANSDDEIPVYPTR